MSKLLSEKYKLCQDVVVVDPASGACEEAKKLDGVTAICTDGVQFATTPLPATFPASIDRILVKECLHYLLADEERFWKGIKSKLTPASGKVIIVTRPKKQQHALRPRF
eukprot:TRINITY_DN15461_c0_g1_i1.p1 TRINITY_DN15461_c0_g1~~TRINITY_DN15461_c0_g1_i1.p1  ORF type:complete len:109 (-),score=17.07 TRINITY_DN15461_c0_g1_i1:310-636(-)